MSFIVTEKAMRPASAKRRCFYCHQPIGAEHKADCVLIVKKVKIRMTVEYEVEAPADWDKHMVEFHRNDGSWCADNALAELDAIVGDGCLCNLAHFEYLGDASEAYVREDS